MDYSENVAGHAPRTVDRCRAVLTHLVDFCKAHDVRSIDRVDVGVV
jgi:hypothetical protein